MSIPSLLPIYPYPNEPVPLALISLLAVILVVIFPEIALWMPQQMIQNIN